MANRGAGLTTHSSGRRSTARVLTNFVAPAPLNSSVRPMDKTTLAILTLASVAGAIVISFAVTLPFIRHYRKKETFASLRITNFVAPYFDVVEAFQVALTEPGARLPFATILQAVLLVAFPVLLILYIR